MKIDVTEQEFELLEAMRNLRNSKHNYSYELEEYVRELIDEFLYDFD